MEDKAEIAYRLDDYDYVLPAELIAQEPSARREKSRLLVLNRSRGEVEHCLFEDVVRFLHSDDVLVVNNTKVVPARLFGTKETGGRIELLILDPYKDVDLGARDGYTCLVKASKGAKPGSRIALEGGCEAEILSSLGDGKAQVRFLDGKPLLHTLNRIGQVPLPPYIRRDAGASATVDDLRSYQTVYANKPGAVAAPTAGLHFSEELLGALKRRGVDLVKITLHVGYGTFSPVRVEDIREHSMHEEYAEIERESAERIENAAKEGRRIVAVGTTVVRVLEWAALRLGRITEFSGYCNHYIYPGYHFKMVDALITNFHLPKSTLLLLVSAFAGREPLSLIHI